MIKIFVLGSASTWPGEIALRLNPNFIREIITDMNLRVVLIAGTNGKTTTAKLLEFALKKKNYRVFHNEEGANLLNGIASSIIKNSSFMHAKHFSHAIFEIDENTLSLVLKQIEPYAIILLNLFRDQLDRYGEVNTIALKWRQSLAKISINTFVFLNGDDPLICSLGQGLAKNVFYFGLDKRLMKKHEVPHDVDSVYCPHCSLKLDYSAISYSHLGDFHCSRCGFKRSRTEAFVRLKIFYPLKGVYNIYNINAVVLVLTKAFGFMAKEIRNAWIGFIPAFGRQEELIYKGRKIIVLLSKNPTGFNQSVGALREYISNRKINLLLLLNDQIPDGRDVSWIWDTEIENLKFLTKKIIISGDRAYDMAVRCQYGSLQNICIYEDSDEAVQALIAQTKIGETCYILPTYSAMLEIRKIIIGKKLI